MNQTKLRELKEKFFKKFETQYEMAKNVTWGKIADFWLDKISAEKQRLVEEVRGMETGDENAANDYAAGVATGNRLMKDKILNLLEEEK